VAVNARLINFNLNYVSAASNGRLQFTAGAWGPSTGVCTLKCHGHDHVDSAYGPLGMTLLKPGRPLHR
jgi:hypothetical protein